MQGADPGQNVLGEPGTGRRREGNCMRVERPEICKSLQRKPINYFRAIYLVIGKTIPRGNSSDNGSTVECAACI